jgi:uncharacterized damage-inducible protein DinB
MKANLEIVLPEFMRYNAWANQQVLASCQALSEAQLAAAAPGGYGTIRATLQHILRSEAHYLKLITGNRPEAAFQWDAPPRFTEMAAYAAQVGQALVQAAEQVGPEARVTQERDGKILHYKALVVFIQILNHGVEHRTNITMTLAQEQLPTPDVGGWGFFWAHQAHFELS